MDQKEIEKTIQFILDQQAKFAADIQQLGEAQKQAEGRLSRLEDAVVIGVNLINDLTKNVSALAEAQKRTENTVSELSEKVDAFIITVERYISEGRNGKPSA